MKEEIRTKEQIKEEINQWKMLHEAGPKMIKETKNRIEELKIKMFNLSKNEKIELEKSMNELQYILMQTIKNVEVAPTMIINLEEEWRKTFKQEMANKCGF